jgi:hypothetical protein
VVDTKASKPCPVLFLTGADEAVHPPQNLLNGARAVKKILCYSGWYFPRITVMRTRSSAPNRGSSLKKHSLIFRFIFNSVPS